MVVWVVFVAAGSALERITLIDSILVFAPLVIVPLTRPLTPVVRPLPSWVELGAAAAIAIAFLLDAGVLAVSLWTLAAVTIFAAAPRTPRAPYFLLVISSLSVLAPMVLAVFWAVSQYTYVAALSIPDMARVHGTLNAFGFVTCGLVGWRLAASSQPASQPAGAT